MVLLERLESNMSTDISFAIPVDAPEMSHLNSFRPSTLEGS